MEFTFRGNTTCCAKSSYRQLQQLPHSFLPSVTTATPISYGIGNQTQISKPFQTDYGGRRINPIVIDPLFGLRGVDFTNTLTVNNSKVFGF